MKKLTAFTIFILTIIATTNLNQIIGQGIASPQAFVFPLLKGGLDTDTASNLLDANSSPNLLNVDLDETNALTIRKGFEHAFTLPVSTDVRLLSSFVANYDDGTSEFFVQAGTGIYKTTGEDVWTRINPTPVSTVYPMGFELFRNRVFMSNGVNNVAVWDTSVNTYTEYPFIPKGRYLVNDRSQLLIAGVFAEPSNVYFSIIGNDGISSADWRGDNFLRCGFGDGQIITGMFKHDGRVYVVKENSIYGLLTDANYTDASIIKYSDLYGSVSNASISSWQSVKILLNRFGLYAYDGGRNWEFIGRNLRSITNRIGLLSGQANRWTTTTSADFSQGIFANCWDNMGVVEVSTHSRTWTTTADFQGAGFSVHRATTTNDEVKLALDRAETEIPAAWVPIDLTGADFSQVGGRQTLLSGTMANTIDGNPDTFVILRVNTKNTDVFTTYYGFMGDITGTNRLRRLKMIYRYVHIPDDPVIVGERRESIDATDRVAFDSLVKRLKAEGWVFDRLLGTVADPTTRRWIATFRFIKFAVPPVSINTNSISLFSRQGMSYQLWNAPHGEGLSLSTAEIIIPDHKYTSPMHRDITEIRWTFNFNNRADIVIHEVEAFAFRPGTTATSGHHHPTGTYTSPIFDTGFTSPQYRSFIPSEWLGIETTSGTITYWTRTSASPDMSSPTAWFHATSTFTNSAIDGNRFFQWRADLWTSTPTATPTCYDITLKYSVLPATFTDRVFDVGSRITSYGSFIGEHEGIVRYQIRAATFPFLGTDAVLTGNATQWHDIVSGGDIRLPITHRFIQRRAILESKDARVIGMTITWATGEGGGGGMQDTPSINWMGKYYIAYSTFANHNTHVLVFNREGRWTRYDWQVSGFANFKNNFYILSSTRPLIFQALVGTTDDGSPINFVYETPDLDYGDPNRKKGLAYLYLTGKRQAGSGCNVELFLDFSTTPTMLGQTYGYSADFSNEGNHRIMGSHQSYGKNMRIRLSTATVNSLEIQRIIPYLHWKDLY